MKKRSVLLVTVALTFLFTSTVFAKSTTNYNCRNLSSNVDSTVYASMMNGYNSEFGMSQENFDAMNEFMEENFGYTMSDVADGSCNMTQEDFNAMNEFMKENFGYSMMDLYGTKTETQGNYRNYANNSGNSTRRSCH